MVIMKDTKTLREQEEEQLAELLQAQFRLEGKIKKKMFSINQYDKSLGPDPEANENLAAKGRLNATFTWNNPKKPEEVEADNNRLLKALADIEDLIDVDNGISKIWMAHKLGVISGIAFQARQETK